ncbi:hypothetical protein [Paucidesulfovibrio gracilis]|uniref:hypothetical protein n=1 Tax=Paucidesulfovibrio gracilis TaxID=47158 RepID=UPI00117D23DC|nr:hypothetical protein [Paucidesulfovibrio gracilis]
MYAASAWGFGRWLRFTLAECADVVVFRLGTTQQIRNAAKPDGPTMGTCVQHYLLRVLFLPGFFNKKVKQTFD